MLRFGSKLLGRTPGLLTKIRYGIREGDIPYTTNPYWMTRKEKRFLENKPVKHESWMDELKFPGKIQQIESVAIYALNHNAANYSKSTIATLLYQLSKHNRMVPELFTKLEPQFAKYLGEFNERLSFGVLYAAVKYDRQELFEFIMHEINLKSHKFTPDEGIEIIGALEVNTWMTYEEKQQFWNQYFHPLFQQFMSVYQDNNPRRVMKIMKELQKLEVYDEVIWGRLVQLLYKKRGWVRTEIYEALFPLQERFPFVKELLDQLHEQISTNVDMRWRYNLQERRLFTNAQMIAKSQQNIVLQPQVRSFFKQSEIEQVTRKFEQLKLKGTLEEQAQLEQDRARALSYVLYDKFKKESADRNLFDPAEFERLYGMTEEQINEMISKRHKAAAKEIDGELEAEGEEEAEGEGVDQEGHEALDIGSSEADTQEQVEKAPIDKDHLDEDEESESESEDD